MFLYIMRILCILVFFIPVKFDILSDFLFEKRTR